MVYLICIISSAILYRIPRGTGFNDSSFLGSLIWASITSVLSYIVVRYDPWLIPLVITFLMAMESFGWSKWWPNNEECEPDYYKRMFKLSLRGSLLLNPLMGPIYFLTYRKFSNWTAVAEVASGAVTMTNLLLVLHIIT